MGFGQAYYNLGLVYAHGITGQINPEEALHMFYEGSLKGDYQCKIMFAYELMNQTSVMKEDYTNHFSLAIQWLEEAINEIRVKQEEKGQSKQLRNDEGEALYYLGLFYMHGFG